MKKDFLKLSDLTKDEALGLIKQAAELKQFKKKQNCSQTTRRENAGYDF